MVVFNELDTAVQLPLGTLYDPDEVVDPDTCRGSMLLALHDGLVEADAGSDSLDHRLYTICRAMLETIPKAPTKTAALEIATLLKLYAAAGVLLADGIHETAIKIMTPEEIQERCEEIRCKDSL